MRKIYLLPFVAFLFFSVSSFAQTTVYLKVADIEGETVNKTHDKEIEASTFAEEAMIECNTGTGTGASTCGKVKTGNFAFDMKLSKASIGLRKKMYAGTAISSVDVAFVKGGQAPVDYYKIKLEDVYVVRMSQSGSNEGIVDQVEFQASKITWTYYPQGSDGRLGQPVTFSWDVKTNAGH